jgi:enterochelin esterase family protein
MAFGLRVGVVTAFLVGVGLVVGQVGFGAQGAASTPAAATDAASQAASGQSPVQAGGAAARAPRPPAPVRDPLGAGMVKSGELPDGQVPPANKDGNFIIGPRHQPAPEMAVDPSVPKGDVYEFTMESKDSKFYPGVERDTAAVPVGAPEGPVSASRPAPYTRQVAVYVPKQYVAGTAAPFMVGTDGIDRGWFTVLDNLIAQKRVPVMIAISVGSGGGDGPGSERGLEYDTMSGKYAEWVQAEVLPLVEKTAGVKLTDDPDGRGTIGSSSGGAASMAMAWYHTDWYHRVLTRSGTFVNQQWPYNDATPHGAWELHEHLIPENPAKPLRVFMEVGDHDNYGPPPAQGPNMHDWVAANENMAKVLAAKGYHYQLIFARNAGHTDRAVRAQILPEALEYVWHGYPVKKN